MGYWKDRMIRESDQGWSFAPDDKFVCAACLDDDALKAFIRDNAKGNVCSYCGRRSKRPTAAPINAVMALIGESIYSEWGHPDDEGIPYESAEGGYQFAVMDIWDLLDHIDFPAGNDDIREEIINSFSDQLFVQRHFYSLPEDDALRYGWRDFTKAVKHKKRYLFAVRRPRKKGHLIPSDVPPPEDMLANIGKVVEEAGLVQTMKAGTPWHRARIHDRALTLSSAADLGTVPQKAATSSNRMSPAGIPMFYGAEDRATAVREICAHWKGPRGAMTLGAFETARDLEVVDLSDIPPVPSLFDEGRRHLRSGISFLHDFVADLTKPINLGDGKEHIEYVPTQIVTEYFRYMFRTGAGRRVRGVIYRSSVNGRRCCVLFFRNRHCCDAVAGWQADPKKWLGLTRVTRLRP